ncbi:hypothetical protein DW322_11065 [Rhodococcus rhodnii]|uniref:Uncharacterized protein n=1 Tax=Rhodococcus rhodnii TaxID=38312 RepID=A0A6P2CE63_9NOCA|nr:hypothetical protein [Rhodococcus rhodnii]TXG90652.1 hypothetical protein DW322_11065 [Rhodococcus rhodnii]
MNEIETLQGLIHLARRERGTSIRQLALQAKGAGFKIVGTTLNAIEKGTYKSEPSDETVRAIGWLAGVSDDVAFAAAGRRVPGPPFAEELPPGVDDLSPRERKAAIEMLRTLIAQRQEINDGKRTDEDPEPRPEASGTVDSSQGSGDRPRRSPPMNDGKVTALPSRDQAPEPDERPQRLAARHVKGGSKEKQRRRAETAPEDQSQGEGPEGGA